MGGLFHPPVRHQSPSLERQVPEDRTPPVRHCVPWYLRRIAFTSVIHERMNRKVTGHLLLKPAFLSISPQPLVPTQRSWVLAGGLGHVLTASSRAADELSH